MGKNLHMRVVAEGVETRQQLDFLKDHGCAQGQGFYLGRPAAPGEGS
jgi:EAL domain-containing protein (putative c-di-GMP-specific phosphodiesterase class I)